MQISIVEMFDHTPKAIVGASAFCKKAVYMRIPFKRMSEGMKKADKTRNKIFGFTDVMKHTMNDIAYRLKKAKKELPMN